MSKSDFFGGRGKKSLSKNWGKKQSCLKLPDLPGKSLDSLESDSYYDNQCSCKNKKNGLYCFKSDDKQAGAELYQPQNQLD